MDDKSKLLNALEGITDEEIFQARLIAARSKFWTNDTEKLIRKWKRQISQRRTGHKYYESWYKKCYYGLGLPMTVITAIVSSGIMATFKNCDACGNPVENTTTPAGTTVFSCNTDVYIRLVMGILGIISVMLCAIFLFMDFGGSQSLHKDTSDSLDSLFREIEDLLNKKISERGDPVAELQKIRNRFDFINQNGPSISEKYETALEYKYIPLDVKFKRPSRKHNGVTAQPPPSTIHLDTEGDTPEKMPDSSILAQILVENMQDTKKKEAIRESQIRSINDYDTDDEEKEVAIPFDIESVRPGDIMENPTSKLVRDSLAKALKFEMARMFPDYSIDAPLVIEKEKSEDDTSITMDDCKSIEMNDFL